MDENAVKLFEMEVAHVGINASDEDEASGWADQFLALMGLAKRETPASFFSDELVEIMKKNGRGKNGHIGFRVNNCEKAIAYFLERGMTTIEETKKFDESGACIFAYFDQEIGGFALHLTQRA